MYNTVAESDGQLVVYHGTGAEFSSFNLSAEGYFGRGGIYFTDSKQAATKFANQCISGGRVVQATISMANPYRVDFEDQTDDVKIEELKAEVSTGSSWKRRRSRVLPTRCTSSSVLNR